MKNYRIALIPADGVTADGTVATADMGGRAGTRDFAAAVVDVL